MGGIAVGRGAEQRLLATLCEQEILRGQTEAAQNLIADGRIRTFRKDAKLIVQGHDSSDVFFILGGRVGVTVNGREVAIREAGTAVGEMALIDPRARRSATVTALEKTECLTVSEATFRRVADRIPALWKAIARILGERLRQRNRFHDAPNPRPVLFIGSATEDLPVARAVKKGLTCDEFLCSIWTDGLFRASNFALEDLEHQLNSSDFAILVFGATDKVTSRGKRSLAPRDNVQLELGLFMGALGRRRCFVLIEEGKRLKLPSDLEGLNLIRYRGGSRVQMRRSVEQACAQLRARVNELGPR